MDASRRTRLLEAGKSTSRNTPIGGPVKCGCGCGKTVTHGKQFLQHHHLRRRTQPRGRFPKGAKHFRWNGGVWIHSGYRLIYKPNHKRANARGYVREHILVMEKHLGRSLRKGEVVDHEDGNGLNNSLKNLKLCKNQGEHLGIHQTRRAIEACGHPDWRRCVFCKEYDAPKNLIFVKRKNRCPKTYHQGCNTNYAKRYRAKISNPQSPSQPSSSASPSTAQASGESSSADPAAHAPTP